MTPATEQPSTTPTPEEVPSLRLEEEGEIAADYLEELLDIADLDGDIDIDVDHGRAAVEIIAEGGSERALQRLAGDDGEVLVNEINTIPAFRIDSSYPKLWQATGLGLTELLDKIIGFAIDA